MDRGFMPVPILAQQTPMLLNSAFAAPVSVPPFFPTLPSIPLNVLDGSWVYAGTDTGAANAYVITFGAGQAVPAAYVTGMEVAFKALVTNTGASTINVNGLGIIAIKRGNGVALAAGDITSGG